MTGGPGDEPVDVLDDAGTVTGTAPRRRVRAENLFHRSVFVAVVTGAGDVVVHRRAEWKDVWPGRWDVCFGGVVAAGEAWDAAAVRELAEESGVVVDAAALIPLGEGRYEDDLVRELARVYAIRSDGPFTFPDGEVAESARVPLADLEHWCDTRLLVPDSRRLVVGPLRRFDHSGAAPGSVAEAPDPEGGTPI